MPLPRTAIWSLDHVEFLAELDRQNLSTAAMSAAMSKRFRMRVTPAHVQALLSKMRNPTHPFFKDIPYRTAGARRSE